MKMAMSIHIAMTDMRTIAMIMGHIVMKMRTIAMIMRRIVMNMRIIAMNISIMNTKATAIPMVTHIHIPMILKR